MLFSITYKLKGVFAVASVLTLSTIFLFKGYLTEKLIKENKSWSPKPIQEASIRSAVPTAAVAFLALGAQANQLNCPAAIESLVRYGGWDGDVYLVTDRMDCFNEKSIVKNAGMNAHSFHLKHVNDHFSGGFDWTGKLGSRAMRMKSMSMKNRLFDFVDSSIDTLLFADCDILFAEPQCVKQMIDEHSSWENISMRFSHVTHDENGKLQKIHAGMFLAHRQHSEEALRRWGEQFTFGIHEHDRDAFLASYEQKQMEVERAKGHSISSSIDLENVADWKSNPLDVSDLVHRTGRNVNRPYENFIDETSNRLYCMNHISKARCSAMGRSAVQRFVDRFNLRTYEGQIPYCTHESLSTLMYGWFPMEYLPFCPKLERLL